VFLDIYIYFSPACSASPGAGVFERRKEPWWGGGGLGLVGFEEKVEGGLCVVGAVGGGGRVQGGRDGRWLPGSGAGREYAIAFGRCGAGDAAVGRVAAEADVRGGGEAFGAGCGPAVGRRCVREAAARVVYGGGHLEGFRHCVGLAGAVEELLDVPASPPLAES
jgi:hypothetical protein